MPILTNIRWRTLLSLTIILSIGLLYSHYRHSIWWLNQEVGGIFYEIFWCLFAFLLIPTRRAVWQIPLWVLVITCLLEFMQLWNPPFLNWVRSFWWGRMLIGTVFTWADFPYYFIGSGLGWLWLRLIFGGAKVK
ncbi:DUF2809 domain-containing protein [Anabaena sp. FACHB-709]|uniref:DUF2809 domain-containing protein n=2 Tax=Nostocaceae TaxID=1162 RepID=A0A1Z4KLV7_ANAVA|nr:MULTISPECIES: DUF2809 domain-containing protein [Nostocaceae]BAY69922.1 hypothetical protein NIES23_27220 [Trichormus variabilis NIES-23]HBW33394.1 DUF2809 domain-containing protein [Nostoc sp. UBA8866]MBD2173623.1 DUF2809 domain-containing protein [Anabaena cylindrica FACHB-318]MBD2265298.1 DUF2809 domain-containing protein [Anabaena sp. FACHB-709]MBD2275290.1 DUF2809 domain-containing protein [Nostoc sp. PCC 7120 = FACHB-418]